MTAKKTSSHKPRGAVILFVIILALLLIACAIIAIAVTRRNADPDSPTINRSSSNEVTLRIACTPEKAALLGELIAEFNAADPRLDDKRTVIVETISMAPDEMVAQAESNAFQALSPDSSIWLGEIDRNWRAGGSETDLVGDTVRYMISPIVIAMWQDVATELGYPAQEIGWSDILRAADEDGLKWSHPSTDSASGLLATLAIFYVGSGQTRDLSEALVTDPETLAYVTTVEKSVKHYGEGELAILQRVQEQGPEFLDAFVVQEQLVIQHNQTQSTPLVAIYPREGTLWKDHPLALLETADRSDGERQAFQLFKTFLLSRAVQEKVLAQGYRPADLDLSLDGPGSPINAANGVDPARPYTTMQMPSSAVITVVKDVWLYTKRHANVYLVVDTSGSMAGSKLSDTQEALRAFCDQMQSDWDRVGMITFASNVLEVMPLTQLGEGRDDLLAAIDRLDAVGNTALTDSVNVAFTKLHALDDSERINAIVVMTDGRENASQTDWRDLAERIEAAQQTETPVLVFCIAYGRDADYSVLRALAEAGDGFASEGDLETIRALYETLSTYF